MNTTATNTNNPPSRSKGQFQKEGTSANQKSIHTANAVQSHGGQVVQNQISNSHADGNRTEPLLYGIRQVSELLQISRSTVYSLCRTGALPFIKIGERRLVEAKEVLNFIQRAKSQQINSFSLEGVQ